MHEVVRRSGLDYTELATFILCGLPDWQAEDGTWMMPESVLAVLNLMSMGAISPSDVEPEGLAEEVEQWLRDGAQGQLPWPLLPRADGQWWHAEKVVIWGITCCGRPIEDRPGVMAYREDLDHGGIQQRKHPGWKELGWLVWLECPQCGRTLFQATDVATLRELRDEWKPSEY